MASRLRLLSSDSMALRVPLFAPCGCPNLNALTGHPRQSSVEDGDGRQGYRVMGGFGKMEGDSRLGQASI